MQPLPPLPMNFGGNPGVIKDGANGIVVPQKDAGKLCSALEEIISDNELYKKLSYESKRIFNERFTAQNMTKQTEKVYEEIMEGCL